MSMINFKMSELIYSEVAKRNKINNMPDIKALDNLLELLIYCLQPIRSLINKPIYITSGYRCAKLNKLVKGAINSQHLFGCAVDFKVDSMKPSEIINIIKNSDIVFDQLINEYDLWTHVSFVKNKNRSQILYYK